MIPRLEDVIAPFRALEENQDALIVIGDDQALRVLIAWTHTDNEWSPPTSKVPAIQHGKMARLWRWVVAGWTFDESELARLSGVPLARVHEKLEVIVGNRLVYPDGSLAKGTRLAIAAYTAERLGIKQHGKAEPKPTKKVDRGPLPDDHDN